MDRPPSLVPLAVVALVVGALTRTLPDTPIDRDIVHWTINSASSSSFGLLEVLYMKYCRGLQEVYEIL